jgi:MFS family permease
MAVFTISIPVEVVFVEHTLHAGAAGYGLLLSAWGAGALVGSAIYARWRAVSSRALMALGAFAFAAGFALMAAAPSLPPAVVGAAVAGVGNGVQIVAMRTALQEATPERWMALILSLNESTMQAAPGIGILIGGGLAALAGPRAALAAGAGTSLIVGIAMWVRLSGSEAAQAAPASAPALRGPEMDISDPALTTTPSKT